MREDMGGGTFFLYAEKGKSAYNEIWGGVGPGRFMSLEACLVEHTFSSLG